MAAKYEAPNVYWLPLALPAGKKRTVKVRVEAKLAAWPALAGTTLAFGGLVYQTDATRGNDDVRDAGHDKQGRHAGQGARREQSQDATVACCLPDPCAPRIALRDHRAKPAPASRQLLPAYTADDCY